MCSPKLLLAALLTKFQPPGKDKPILRPYTPVNDEGISESHLISTRAILTLRR